MGNDRADSGAAFRVGVRNESLTEDFVLAARGGAANGYGLLTEDYLLGAVSGAAGGYGRYGREKDVA